MTSCVSASFPPGKKFIAGPAGQPDTYNDRAIAFLEIRWGRLVSWEDYEDTKRIVALDEAMV